MNTSPTLQARNPVNSRVCSGERSPGTVIGNLLEGEKRSWIHMPLRTNTLENKISLRDPFPRAQQEGSFVLYSPAKEEEVLGLPIKRHRKCGKPCRSDVPRVIFAMKNTISILLAAGLLAGCSPPQPARNAGPYVKPALIMVTPDQAVKYGLREQPPPAQAQSEVLPVETNAVLQQSNVKVYTFNRVVDAADPDLMHETHVVYRRETGPRWQLQASTSQQILVGPRVTDSCRDISPVKDSELNAYLAEQRDRQREDRQAIEVLFKGLDTLTKQGAQQMKLIAALAKAQQVATEKEAERNDEKPAAGENENP